MLQLLKNNWRPVAVVAALVLAFACGRFATPTKTVEHTVTVDRVVTKTVEVQAEAKERIVFRDRTVITHPDGTVEHRDIVKTDSSDKTSDTHTAQASHETQHVETRTAERIVTSDAPRLHVNLLVAIDVTKLTPAYGAQVEYRVLGPIWVGAFGLSSGVGGLSLGVTF